MQERQETSIYLGPHGTARAAMAMAAMAAAIIQVIWQVVEESRGKKARRLPLLQRPRSGRAGGNMEHLTEVACLQKSANVQGG